MNDKKESTSGQYDIIERVLSEAKAYESLDDIEKIVENGMTLGQLPVQPLYMTIKANAPEVVCKVLPRLSKEQRKVFLDLDLWQKDKIDVNSFQYWIQTYAMVKDDQVRSDFVQSEEFLLFLKSRFNIWTFDTEDPQYPDHDYYFLSEDGLFLFEYDEHFLFVDEVKLFIRNLYYELGVDKAYSLLFKYVSESFSNIQEQEYQRKKEFLRDYGMVDYYDALEVESTYQNTSLIDHFLRNKAKRNADVSPLSLSQSLPRSTVVPYQQYLGSVRTELAKVQDQARLDYLHFNFIRLVNSTLSAAQALKEGSVATTRIGKITCSYISLGLDYIRIFNEQDEKDVVIFDFFDFTEIYRVGKSLTNQVLKEMKKGLTQTEFENDFESFLGRNWCEFLDFSFDNPPKLSLGDDSKEQTKIIDQMVTYHKWVSKKDTFCQMLPFIHKFFDTYQELINEGKISDDYYLNYDLKDIDFEALILSTFANFVLGTASTAGAPKLAITIEEFREFSSMFLDKDGRIVKDEFLIGHIEKFVTTFGLDQISGIQKYLKMIIVDHFEGYDFQNLPLADFAHVGGAVILKTQ